MSDQFAHDETNPKRDAIADKQTWHGKTELRYWRQKIYKPTYLRGGQRVEAKHWATHLQRNGTCTSLTLDTPIREAAATKARERVTLKSSTLVLRFLSSYRQDLSDGSTVEIGYRWKNPEGKSEPSHPMAECFL
jgi:hypothetical protein